MKIRLTFLIIALLFFALPTLQAQQSDAAELEDFAAIYSTGEKWDDSLSPAEQPYFMEHSMFLYNLRKNGVITLGMRVADKGIIILKAKNLEEAKKVFQNDVSVSEKTFSLEIQPATVFYKGCVGGI